MEKEAQTERGMHNKTVVTHFTVTLSAEPGGILGLVCSAAPGLPVQFLLPGLSVPAPSLCFKKGSDNTDLTEEP